MKRQLFVFVIAIVCTTSCASWKNMPNSSSLYSQAVNIAIRDLATKYPASNKYSSLNIAIYTHNDFHKSIDSNLLVVSIIDYPDKFFPNASDTLGSRRGYLPTQHTIYKDRLFYWVDPNYTLNKKTVDALNKFNLIDSTNIKDPSANFFTITNNDNAFLVEYYFCINNLNNYKSIRMGGFRHRPTPKLNCNKQKRVRTK